MTSLRFPLQLSPQGRLVTSDNPVDVVRDAILSGLLTELGERVYRPYYGRDVQVLTTYSQATLATRLKDSVITSLFDYDEVSNVKVTLQQRNGTLVVNVQFEIDNQTLYLEIDNGTNT